MSIVKTYVDRSARWLAAGAAAVVVVLALGLAVSPKAALAQSAATPVAGEINTRERPMYGLTAPGDADLLRALQGVEGQVTIPDQRLAKLIQPQGRDWRKSINGPLRVIGSWLILGMIVVLLAFFLARGQIRIEGGPSGTTIERFNGLDRFTHWLTASAFVVLALTGLNITFGRYLLLPILGPEAFTTLSLAFKYAHNFAAFPFMLGVAMMFVLWVQHNIPDSYDAKWIMMGGGLFKRGVHPPARMFNAGQKFVFWSVVLGGGVIAVSGVYLLFPFMLNGDIHTLQLMAILHSIFALILTAIAIAHIYIGSIGMEGAFAAMGTGQVDERWAREHHPIWVAELKGEPLPKLGGD